MRASAAAGGGNQGIENTLVSLGLFSCCGGSRTTQSRSGRNHSHPLLITPNYPPPECETRFDETIKPEEESANNANLRKLSSRPHDRFTYDRGRQVMRLDNAKMTI